MADVPLSEVSPNRMIEDLEGVPPLSRSSYVAQHFIGLRIRAEGIVTGLFDGAAAATVAFKCKGRAKIHADFQKPLSPELEQLRVGDDITIIGVVDVVADYLVGLHDCSLFPSETPLTSDLPRDRWTEKWWGNLSIQTLGAILGGIIAGVVVAYVAWRYFH